MNTYSISIEKISTLEVNIINIKPPSGERLNININRNIRQIEDSSFLCILTASICRETEKDTTEHEFLVKYVISAIVKCNDPTASADDLQDTITKELYPHIRASISSIMGAAGLDPILLPTLVI